LNIDRSLWERVSGLLKDVTARHLSAAVTRVHGDLHLENVLIDPTGARTYLIDFGASSDEGSICADLARLESDLIYRLLPFDLTADQIAAFEQAAWDGKLADQPASVCRTLITLLRTRIEQYFATSYGQVWYLIGRLVNGMRMLAGTWHEVTPSGFDLRRRGIVASLGVIASRLKTVLAGSSLVIVQPTPPEPHGQADAEQSLRWLFVQRHSSDAWNLASKIGKTGTQLTQNCCFLGALAGASIGRPADEVAALVARAPTRVTQPGPKGLRALYLGFQRARAPNKGALAAAAHAFEDSQEAFKESGDDLFRAIAADQLARVRRRQGNYEAAKIQFDTSIELKSKAGDNVGHAASLGGLAQLHLRTLEYKLARELYQKDFDLVASFDPISAIRLHNWIGQALLEENVAQVTEAIGQFDQSLALAQSTKMPAYNPASDIGFANFGRGACYTRSDAIDLAEAAEAAARDAFESLDQEDVIAIALVELLSGEIAFCRGHPRTGMVRTLSGLDRMEGPMQDRLIGLDHGVRACRFLRRIGRTEDCRKIAGRLRARFKDLHSQKVQRILQDLEKGS
jgi:tetratricopeptide (TPR) repeat protein